MSDTVFVSDAIFGYLGSKGKLTDVERRVYNFFNRDKASVIGACGSDTFAFWGERGELPKYVREYVVKFIKRTTQKPLVVFIE